MVSKRTKLKLLTLLLSLGFGLLASEIILRVINYRPILMDPTLYVANQSDIQPYKLRANYDGLYGGQKVTTDADGYRIVSPNPTLAQAVNRENAERVILLLGDSGVFGHGLSNEDTFGSQLQNLLYAKKLNYKVNNIGVSGYTSWNELGALKDYLQRHTATDVMVVYVPNDITLENDFFGIGKGKIASYSQGRFTGFTTFIYSHVYTAYLVSDSVKKIIARLKSGGNQGTSGTYDIPQTAQALDYSMTALRQMQELCQSKNIRFSVGIYRDVDHYLEPEKSLAYEKQMTENLSRNGIKSFVIKSHIDNLKMSEAKVLWNDAHPSARAVHFIAGDLLQALD